VIAACAFLFAARSYEGDKARAAEPVETVPQSAAALA